MGNVGINTEPNYNYQLDVVGNVRLSSTQISQNDFAGLATIGGNGTHDSTQVTDVNDSTITYQVYTFTNPTNIGYSVNTFNLPMDTKIGFIQIAGGGGGGSSTEGQCGTGGGGGGILYNKLSSNSITLTANNTYRITVGKGGDAGDGGDSTGIYNNTTSSWISAAYGGGRGTQTASDITGGAGGTVTTYGGISIVGGNGGGSSASFPATKSNGAQIDISGVYYYTSGGGGSGTATAPLGASAASNNPATGLGSNVIGTTGTSSSRNGGTSTVFGGGGGGAARGADGVGGTGGPGIVIIYFKVPSIAYKNSAIHLDTYLKTLPASSICAIDNGFGSNDMTFNTTPYTNVSGQNVERLRIKDNGYIGIGTSTPGHMLDVNGDVRLRGKTYIGVDNPGGGWGDTAVIEYTSTSDTVEKTFLRIGVGNDGAGLSEDKILLDAAGGTIVNNGLDVKGLITANGIIWLSTVTSAVGFSDYNYNTTAITAPPINNGISRGTADGTDGLHFNLAINSWSAIGFVDTCFKKCYIWMNVREGSMNAKGLITAGSFSTDGHITAGSITVTTNLDVTGQIKATSAITAASFTTSGTAGTINAATITATSAITAASFNATSDYRIKENVEELDENFTVNRLRPVHYYNKSLQKQDIGFIAHEVQEHFPYLVTGEKDGKDMQSLNYTGLIGILVKEIQDLKKVISEQQKTITEQQKRVDDIIKRIG